MIRLALILGFVLAAVTPAAAAQAESGPFQIMKATESQVWRLNTQTGEIAVCTLDGDNLVCTTTSEAAMAPARSYEEVVAEREAEAEAAEQAAVEQREQDLQMLDRFLQLIREFIGIALGENTN